VLFYLSIKAWTRDRGHHLQAADYPEWGEWLIHHRAVLQCRRTSAVCSPGKHCFGEGFELDDLQRCLLAAALQWL